MSSKEVPKIGGYDVILVTKFHHFVKIIAQQHQQRFSSNLEFFFFKKKNIAKFLPKARASFHHIERHNKNF
jgi:hypothetical protein